MRFFPPLVPVGPVVDGVELCRFVDRNVRAASSHVARDPAPCAFPHVSAARPLSQPFGRKIIQTDRFDLVVANVNGEYYAMNAKHPFLPVSLANAEITLDGDGPCLSCSLPLHVSKFSLTDGSVRQSSGLFAQTDSPATAFPVFVDETTGRLTVDLTKPSFGETEDGVIYWRESWWI